MSTAAEKIKEQATRIASHQNAQSEVDAPVRHRAAGPRARPVRRTVDLSPTEHDELEQWQRQIARELGRARVTGQDVLRALVGRLLSDDTVSRKIRGDLAGGR